MPFVVAAYLLWGLFPAFFPLLDPASPLEILAHRVIWTAALVTIFLVFTGSWRELVTIDRRSWGWLTLASLAITINWGTYVVAITTHHAADAALGYFINPLVSVALGVIILKESLPRLQALAVGIASIAVMWLTFSTGQVPVLALGLAFSFAFYGLIKKQVKVSATVSVAAETLIASPLALAFVGYLQATEASTFLKHGLGHTGLLMVSGLVTALPLILFTRGAKELPLSAIGMMQYMTPTIVLLWAVFVNQEHMPLARWIGFIFIWIAVIAYCAELLHQRHRRLKLK
ncbi:MAG: EamA family transporter RarD [Corynebacterium sp.]|nr:EamA family transporter RarD [Corynebacterium sp.]